MEVVDQWTGQLAGALQKALRLTNEGFAGELGTAVRTVAKWNAEPELVPVPEIQRALDTLLCRAPEDARARFARIAATESMSPDEAVRSRRLLTSVGGAPSSEAERRLADDRNITAALQWLDKQTGGSPGRSRKAVAERLASIDPCELQDRGRRRILISREQIANALTEYYATGLGEHQPYSTQVDGQSVATSVLVRKQWLDLGLDLAEGDRLRLDDDPEAVVSVVVDELGADAATQRLAETLITNARIINSPLYRLTGIDVSHEAIEGTVGVTDFVSYALTMDLLEAELIDALAEGRPMVPGSLPLRDRYLPDVNTVVNVDRRLCAGGALALFAVARPGSRARRGTPDYLLLIQERSGHVLNSARRLAVIPKAFHEPLVDYADDTQLAATLEREMEEELFGRDDVDSTEGGLVDADPMHPTRLSEPMRWLYDRAGGSHWRMECTGFGLNLVSGNFEFASLIVIEDEEWWTRYGGRIRANWESHGLRRYSTLDRSVLKSLTLDPAWSNEGLFALTHGLRRLADIDDQRVNLPTIE
ncbi:hypothetical protein [Planobispora takensis]|uniref:Uncharacterized protein n=1 Tax=Planobispora takensis TaxID=1367882 RepID=A0A8J3SYT9_9ACTN|nr:hypothetical protein [Planobispora takensis]GII01767.1 hypothetical protein Pta02_37750 [Planobispora takensis]